MATYYCEKCGRMLNEKEFYTSQNLEKYPNGKLNQCKKCITMHVDNYDPETFKWIIEELDIPYIKQEWDNCLERWGKDATKLTGTSILGRYISKMKLNQYAGKRWADGLEMEEQMRQRKIEAMQAKGMTPEDIEETLEREAQIKRPDPPPQLLVSPIQPRGTKTPMPQVVAAPAMPLPQENSEEAVSEVPLDSALVAEDASIAQELSDEDKLYLQVKWGSGYTFRELVRMEQLYNDMMASYDIQGAAHKDTLILICKTSLKANQCIDSGFLDDFQRISKTYNDLMKSGKFQAIQNKDQEAAGIDSVGQLVAMCERDGFIPRYYIEQPNDKVDRVLQDMQNYTHDLVTEELGLENLIHNSLRAIQEEREAIAAAAAGGTDDEGSTAEDDLFNYGKNVLDDQDLRDYNDFQDALDAEQEEALAKEVPQKEKTKRVRKIVI